MTCSLPRLATAVGGDEQAHDFGGRCSLRQQIEPRPREGRIDERLRRKRADAASRMRTKRADREEPARDRDAERSARIAGQERPGHCRIAVTGTARSYCPAAESGRRRAAPPAHRRDPRPRSAAVRRMITAELRPASDCADGFPCLPQLMRVRNLGGLVFTIPYKLRACALADELEAFTTAPYSGARGNQKSTKRRRAPRKARVPPCSAPRRLM